MIRIYIDIGPKNREKSSRIAEADGADADADAYADEEKGEDDHHLTVVSALDKTKIISDSGNVELQLSYDMLKKWDQMAQKDGEEKEA
jgi:hypothetical protein